MVKCFDRRVNRRSRLFAHEQQMVAHEKALCAIHKRSQCFELSEVLDRRLAFYFQLLSDAHLLHDGRVLVDLGAGISWFGPIASVFGLKVTLVDDFGGGGGVEIADREQSLDILKLFREIFGIEIVEQDFAQRKSAFCGRERRCGNLLS